MKKGSIVLLLFVLMLLLGIGMGVFYFYFYHDTAGPVTGVKGTGEAILKSYTNLKIFFPVGERMEMTEKQISKSLNPLEMADTLMGEFIRVSREVDTGLIPEGTALNNVFISPDGIVYLDFNRAFKRNFHGDAMDEYLLIKGIYDTLVSNMDVRDVFLLVEGSTVESIGGHFLINRPLRRVLLQEARTEEARSDEQVR